MWATCPRSALSENGRVVAGERHGMCELAYIVQGKNNISITAGNVPVLFVFLHFMMIFFLCKIEFKWKTLVSG
jgi:hypothetical protein